MHLWPFKPLRDYAETLAWLTDVLRARSAEQRIAMRTAPRMIFPYQFLFNAQQFSRAQSMARALGADTFLLPLWGDVSAYGDVGSGVSVLAVDTRFADYRVGGKMMIWASDESYEIGVIDSKTDDSITLASPTTQAYSNVRLAPVVAVTFAQLFSSDREGGNTTPARAAFVSTDSVDLSDAGSYPDYRGEPVMTDCIRLLGGISERYEREGFVIDNETGLITPIADMQYPVKSSMMNWRPWNKPDLFALRQWLHYCRGRQRGFWLPSYNNDLQITANITSGGSTITVQAVGYPNFETVRDIMIEDTSGNRYYRRINSGVEGGGNTEVLTLSAAAGINLTVAQVRRISYLTYMRNNADRIEIQHYAPGKATVSVPVMEAPAP